MSKSNRHQIITLKGHASLVKSKKAQAYERDVLKQIPPAARQRLEGPVRFTAKLYYSSELPDLDESLLLDCLQDRYSGKGEQRALVQAGVYRNDRAVRERHIYHGIDKANPRAEVEIEPLLPQQAALEGTA